MAGQALEAKLLAPATDADGDALAYRYAWYRDGVRVKLPADRARVEFEGDGEGAGVARAACAWDGEVEGPEAAADAVIGANGPPGVVRVAVTPAEARTGEALTCAVTEPARDPDGDCVAYRVRWKLGAAYDPNAEGAWTIPGARVRKGQSWTCEVTPTDGEADGPVAVASATVRNSPPGAAKLSLSPAKPTVADEAGCWLAAPASDVDGDVPRYTFRWTRRARTGPGRQAGPVARGGRGGQRGGRRGRLAARRGGDPQGRALDVRASRVGRRGGGARRARDDDHREFAAHATRGPARAGAPRARRRFALRDREVESRDPDGGDRVTYRFVWYKGGVRQDLASTSLEVPGRVDLGQRRLGVRGHPERRAGGRRSRALVQALVAPRR